MASTLLNELGFPSDVIELQLAHSERNKVRAAYNNAQGTLQSCVRSGPLGSARFRFPGTTISLCLVFAVGGIAMSHFDLRPPTEAQRAQITARLDLDERRVLLEHGT